MGSYLFLEFDYSLCIPYLFVSPLKRTVTNLPALFDDGNVKGQPIILVSLITVITAHFGYTPDLSNVVVAPAEIGISYMTNTKWIVSQSVNKFRWFIAKKEFILLLDLA